jgi:hypothetical protein
LHCNGSGYVGGEQCTKCKDGFWQLTECPKRYIGSELVEAINFAGYAIAKGWFPVEGGLLKQSSWFFDLITRLEQEQNLITQEQHERAFKR